MNGGKDISNNALPIVVEVESCGLLFVANHSTGAEACLDGLILARIETGHSYLAQEHF